MHSVFLTFGIKPRLPSLPTPEIKCCYGESYAAEWFANLQHCHQISAQHNMHASYQMQAQFNRKSFHYKYVLNH